MSHEQSRRGFLRNSIAIVPVAALTGTARTQGTSSESPASAAPNAARYNPVFFHAVEWSFIQAAVA